MRLTSKLLSFIHRAFSNDPLKFLALRLRYAGGMTWRVDDKVLTTVAGGGLANLRVPLDGHAPVLGGTLAEGDGVTAAFALPAGLDTDALAVYAQDWQGRRTLYPTPRTNLLTYSEQFDNAAWEKVGVTVLANQATAPDGTNTMDAVTFAAAGGSLRHAFSGGVVTYTLSFWAQAAAGDTVTLGLDVSDSPSSTIVVTDVPQRYSVTLLDGGGGSFVDIGAADKTVYLWGAQLETGSAPTSYIPTTSAAATVTDYTAAAGTVTFSAVPLLGASLTYDDLRTGAVTSADAPGFTIATLANFLAAQPGYSVEYADASELSLLSAAVLLDGAGDIGQSNGDHLYGYRSVLWSYLEAASGELTLAEAAITEMLDQMSTRTADAEWLDELGGYYAVPRLDGEADAAYGPRIIAEVLRPRGNNVAIEAAIKTFTGQDATVTDVVLWAAASPQYGGASNYDGTIQHNAASSPRYGLFDVEYGYDLLNGGDIADFQAVVSDLVNRLRDAGTHIRSLLLQSGTMSDSFATPPSDADATLTVSLALTYNGARNHDGYRNYNSGGVLSTESL